MEIKINNYYEKKKCNEIINIWDTCVDVTTFVEIMNLDPTVGGR